MTTVRMPLKSDNEYIYESIELGEKAFTFYQKLYPQLDIEHELALIAQYFRFVPKARVASKKELGEKVLLLLKKASRGQGISEKTLKTIVGEEYVSLELLTQFENAIRECYG